MNDASEVLLVIFDCLHRAFTEPAAEPLGEAAASASGGAASVNATAANDSADNSFVDVVSGLPNQKPAGSWDCPASSAAWDRAYLAGLAESSALNAGSVPSQTAAPGQNRDVGVGAGSAAGSVVAGSASGLAVGSAAGSAGGSAGGSLTASGASAVVSSSPLSYGAVLQRQQQRRQWRQHRRQQQEHA
ncbi:hypothetical protein CLOP_g17012 [Closterium sp. NIES-67]|nr:hypothetical protein CLOP_g17012 [Closterium sp. NIES-67]